MATQTKRWTLDEVHSLPDDGNKYELVRGELFVTPAPTMDHETLLARLTRLLDPYVETNGLGLVYHPRAVFQFEGSEVEPDLMVRQPPPRKRTAWKDTPLPILIVEVFSPYTRRRDRIEKRVFYLDAGIAEYWMVDPEEASITIARPGREDETVRDRLAWSPRADTPALALSLAGIFGRGVG